MQLIAATAAHRCAVRTLLLVAAALACVLAAQWGSQQWLLSRLTHELDQQPADVQMERLAQIAQMGSPGLPVLVTQLKAADERVAEAAFDLLKQQQQQWLQLTDEAADTRHRQLASELASLGSDLELRRGGWVAMLLNQTIVETVEHPSDDAALAYQTATDLLTKLSVSDLEDQLVRPSPSTARVALRTEPLPVEQSSTADKWQSVPANNAAPLDSDSVDGKASSAESASTGGAGQTVDATQEAALQSIPPQTTVPLQSPDVTRVRENAHVHHVVVPVQHLSEQPFDAYTTRSVIAWLRSVQPPLRDSAHHELCRRGFDEQQLALAGRLADPDVRVRLGLLNEITRRTDVEPRQWLMWLAEDAEPDVRRRAVAALGTMNDAAVTQYLREQLASERDPAVADLIRRILSQR